jgi:uncharacterized protein (DUF1800 family)
LVAENFIDEMATVMRDNDYELMPVLKALFQSVHFNSEQFYGTDIRNPLNIVAGTSRLILTLPTRLPPSVTVYLNGRG